MRPNTFFWLSTVALLGAVVARLIPLGFLEILIVWALANAIFYAASRRSVTRTS
jgi:uncharacterized membrane protein (DUF485 family)